MFLINNEADPDQASNLKNAGYYIQYQKYDGLSFRTISLATEYV